MRRLSPAAWMTIRKEDDEWVNKAEELVKELEPKDIERQLRIIHGVAEASQSWEAVKLFIRYQASRETKLGKRWAERAINTLEGLKSKAEEVAKKTNDDGKSVHLELVARVLGYAVRWQKAREEGVIG